MHAPLITQQHIHNDGHMHYRQRARPAAYSTSSSILQLDNALQPVINIIIQSIYAVGVCWLAAMLRFGQLIRFCS